MSDNDDIQIGRILSRREVLVLLGAAGTAATIAACAPGATASPSATAAGASAASSGAAASATAVATSSELAGTPSCVVVPALTEGPYYVDEKLQRSDITANADGSGARPGATLTLAFAVSTVAASGCTPLANALVDVWHCDAVGSYSDISASGNGSDTTGQNWLRGYQLTDASGKATFKTVYPGWYQGRTVHIHFKIRTDAGASGGTEFTSQLFFDDAINDAVLATTPYSTKGNRSTRNDSDSIFGQSNGMLTLALAGDATAGFTTTFEVGLQA
jgi:protocatechuate 3,4-dioxygenase beta subunit